MISLFAGRIEWNGPILSLPGRPYRHQVARAVEYGPPLCLVVYSEEGEDAPGQ